MAHVGGVALFLSSTLSGTLCFTTKMSLGFGEPNRQNTVSFGGTGGIAAAAIIANLPHLIFSVMYLQWNTFFTSMAMGKEWNDFSLRRAPLRVSDNPRGEQRSRYFLQLPYRFSIPLMAVSILLHWMLSQAVFVLAVETIVLEHTPPTLHWASAACGYSPVAILTILVASLVIPGSVFTFGRCLYAGPAPVVGSCSLAIAAACHHLDGKGHPDVALNAVKWGVMADWDKRQMEQGEQDDRNQGMRHLLPSDTALGHCGFSDEFVDKPQLGEVYA